MKNFFSVLDECLDTIKRGGDLESCLAAYPEYEDLLRTFIQQMRSVEPQRPEANPDLPSEQVPFDQALDECIKAVGAGEESPAGCYKRYPSYARKMKPWLDTVVDLRRYRMQGLLQPVTSHDEDVILEVPFTEALEEYLQALKQNKPGVVLKRYPYYAQKMQFWADQVPDDPDAALNPTKPAIVSRLSMQVENFFSRFSLQMSLAASLALFLFLFSGLGLANAAAATLPGDSLYPLKLTIEQVQLNIGFNDQKANLKTQFAEERRKETSALIHSGLKQDVAFDGEITSVDQNKVMVSNVAVLLDGVDGKLPKLQKGEKIHIEGTTSQKGVVIKKINIHTSNGESNTFVASTATPSLGEAAFSLKPTFAVQASPTSTSVSTAIPTFTPTDTLTLEPTVTQTDVPTLAPTLTPTEILTSAPTQTPTPIDIPTLAPTLTPTDVPTVAPTATPTEVPSLEPSATSTDVPTMAPTPTATEVSTLAPTLQSIITADPTNTSP